MPIVFVHGVAVRQEDDPLADVVGEANSHLWEQVEPMIRTHLAPALNPDAPQDVHVAGFYWGDLGVQPTPVDDYANLLDGTEDLAAVATDALAAALQEYGFNTLGGKKWPAVVEAAWALARDPHTARELALLEPKDQARWLVSELSAAVNEPATLLAGLLSPVGEGAESLRRRSWRRVAHQARKGYDQFTPIFVGDILTYSVNRGTVAEPGPIITRFADTMNEAQEAARASGEPLIVFSHSMGGQLVFDAVTAFRHLLNGTYIDLWCAAGGQVGVYLGLGLFLEQNVTDISHTVGYLWNAWSSSDLLSFPIEGRIRPGHDTDFAFGSTLWDSHGAYLSSPVFFETLAAMIRVRTQGEP